MPLDTKIRAIVRNDLSALKKVIDANDLFPSDMLDEMLSGYLDSANVDNEKASEFWFTYEDVEPVAIAYCAPEKMTSGTWNLYLIAVHPDHQGKGYGTSMLLHIEQILAEQGERVLLVETSGLDDFAPTRSFYQQRGYEEEARIREFYQAGEDKIVFRKMLTNREKPDFVYI